MDAVKVRHVRPDVLMIGLRSIGRGQGGVEAHVEQLSDELDKVGYAVEVTVRTPYSGRKVLSRGRAIRIVPIWSPKSRATEAIIHSFFSVLHAALRRPRILHIHAIGPSLMIPLARAMGLRVVFTHHGEDYNREKWGLIARTALKLGERFGARYAHERICVSRSLAGSLSKKYQTLFRYIPNGVQDVARTESSAILDKMDVKSQRYVLHVGRVVPEKRQADLIMAIEKSEIPDIKLVLVGTPDHESDYSRYVDSLAASSSKVIQAGFQSGLALAELYSHAGIFALPSTHEGLPIALLEAMSYGCRVVASDIEANLNLGLPNFCYFPATSVDGLADKIERAFANKGEVLAVNWSKLLEGYNWREIASKTIEAYEAAAGSKSTEINAFGSHIGAKP